MGTYVVFTKLTPQGRKNLHDDPDAPAAKSRRQAEQLGAKIIAAVRHDRPARLRDRHRGRGQRRPSQRIGAEISGLGTMKMQTFPAIKIDRFQQLLKMEPYRTEPHRWQTSFWARAVRRMGRPFTTTRYVRQYCKPLTVEGRENLKRAQGRRDRHRQPQLALRLARRVLRAAGAHPQQAGDGRGRRQVLRQPQEARLVAVAVPERLPRAPRRRHEAARVPDVAAQARLVDPHLPGGRPLEVRTDRALQGRPGHHGDAGEGARDPDLHGGPARHHAEGQARRHTRPPMAPHRQARSRSKASPPSPKRPPCSRTRCASSRASRRTARAACDAVPGAGDGAGRRGRLVDDAVPQLPLRRNHRSSGRERAEHGVLVARRRGARRPQDQRRPPPERCRRRPPNRRLGRPAAQARRPRRHPASHTGRLRRLPPLLRQRCLRRQPRVGFLLLHFVQHRHGPPRLRRTHLRAEPRRQGGDDPPRRRHRRACVLAGQDRRMVQRRAAHRLPAARQVPRIRRRRPGRQRARSCAS